MNKLTNFRKSLEEAAAKVGDTLQTVVVGWHDNDDKKWKNYTKEFPMQTWEQAAPSLDYDYYSGFGGADCHAVIAWGNKFVFFVHEYDGATSIRALPRNPSNCAPRFDGLGTSL